MAEPSTAELKQKLDKLTIDFENYKKGMVGIINI